MASDGTTEASREEDYSLVPEERDRQLDALTNQINRFFSTGRRRVVKHNENSYRVWTPADIPTADELGRIADLIRDTHGEKFIAGDDRSSRILPKRNHSAEHVEGGEMAFDCELHRFVLTNKILEAEQETKDLINAAGSQKKKDLDSLRLLKSIERLRTRARSRIYYSVSRQRRGSFGDGQAKYDYIVYFYGFDPLSQRSLKPLEEDIKKHARRTVGDINLSVRTIRRPILASQPRGEFGKDRQIVAPGYAILSPKDMVSSMTCLAVKKGTDGPIQIIGSGHGLTDFASADVGDSVYRPFPPSRTPTEIGTLLDKEPVYQLTGSGTPAILFDFARVECTRPQFARNTINMDPPEQLHRIRSVAGDEFTNQTVNVEKVGCATQHQVGVALNNRANVNVVDEIGNVVMLHNQIVIKNDRRAFARQMDSGGLVFIRDPEENRIEGIGGITATSGVNGGNGLTFASHLEEFLEKNDLMLWDG